MYMIQPRSHLVDDNVGLDRRGSIKHQHSMFLK